MHLMGKEAISVVTQRSARTLLATALVVFMAKYFNVPVADMEVFGKSLPIPVFTIGSIAILLIMIINHLVHWSGDYLSFQNWNVKEKVNGPSLFDAGSSIVTRLDYVIEMNKQMADECNGNLGRANKEKLEQFLTIANNLGVELSMIKSKAISLHSFAAFYLYGWQLAFPVGVALLAIVWPVQTLTTPL